MTEIDGNLISNNDEPMGNNVKLIYHYTDLSSLEGILKSKKLRLSSCKNYQDVGAETVALKKAIEHGCEISPKFKDVIRRCVESYEKKGLTDNQVIEEVLRIRDDTYMAMALR